MRDLAREMNLSETAFVWPVDGGFSLRWLTPSTEVDLCGHATLAAAFVLWETGVCSPSQAVCFFTRSGWLTCTRESAVGGGWITLDFPAMPCEPHPVSDALSWALGCTPSFGAFNGMDWLVEVENEEVLRGLAPDFGALTSLTPRGVIVTSSSRHPEFDFVSRFFAPGAGINEDPVTGSAHCALGPYWGPRLGKVHLRAYQASSRGGAVRLTLAGERVLIQGQAVMMARLELFHWR